MQAGKNPSFVKSFGPHAVSVQMGEYTVMPDSVLKRANHADTKYLEVRYLASADQFQVWAEGKPVVIESADKIVVHAESSGAQEARNEQAPPVAALGSNVQPGTFPDLEIAAVAPGAPRLALEERVRFVEAGEPDGTHHVLTLGDVVAEALTRAGLTVEQWNAQPEEAREDMLRALVEGAYAAARAKQEGEEGAGTDAEAP